MWYKNITGRFFRLVTKHACDGRTEGQTDRITAPKTVLAQLRRAVKSTHSTIKNISKIHKNIIYRTRNSQLEFNVPFQHKYGYIRDEGLGIDDIITVVQRHKLRLYGDVLRKDEND